MILGNGFQELQDIDAILLMEKCFQIKSGVSQLGSKHLQVHQTTSILQGRSGFDFVINLSHRISVKSSSLCAANTSLSKGALGSEVILEDILQSFHSGTHFKKIDGATKEVDVEVSFDLSGKETSLGKDHLRFSVNSSIQVRGEIGCLISS